MQKREIEMKKISIIVPCFNEEKSLPLFYKEIVKVLKKLNYIYELILVDDGSKDKTLDEAKKICKKDKNVFYITFSRNFGKEAAMLAGLKHATGDYVGFIDADLQHPPILLKQMCEALETREYDCAACKRTTRTGDSKVRTWFARKFYKIINKVSDAQMMDGAGDYRLMTRKMVNAILSMEEHNRFSKGIFSWVGFNTYWIDYENVDRVAGESSWSFIGLVKYAFNGIFCFSNAPLDLIFVGSFIIFLLTLILMILALILNNNNLLLAIIIVLSSIQLISLGIIGQYISRIYAEVRNRPQYIISDTNKKDIKRIN